MTTALIVEDDGIVSAFLSYILESEDISPISHNHGDEVDYGAMYDLALIDLVLPDISGLAVANRLRANGDVPIIFVTGSTDYHNIRLMLSITNHIITKPFTESRITDLRQAVQKIKGGRNESTD